MVDSTTAMVISKTNAPQVISIEDINIFAAHYYGNAMALIKLWETEKSKKNDASRASKASKVSNVPRGAFRRILEYYEPV